MKERRKYYCAYCKEPLDTQTDIIRFHKNEIYHLDCYTAHINKDNDFESYPCPKCYTTGKSWIKSKDVWIKCRLCKGKGYLIIEDAGT